MLRSLSSIAAALVAATAFPLTAQMKQAPAGNAPMAACDVRGVWELESGKVDGVPYPDAHMYKLITRTHWAWVSRDDTAPKELKSVADTLLSFRTRGGATGTYQVQGTTYTETVEVFTAFPQYEGKSFPFTCRVEGDRFYQSGKFPMPGAGNTVKEVMLEEVYRRVEQP